MKIGVLALQGAFREHAEALTALGADVAFVKRPEHLEHVDAIVLPGGESTTIDKLLDSSELRAPWRGGCTTACPRFATSAGLILSATEVIDGRPDQRSLNVLDVTVRRNGYGRQRESFEMPLAVRGLADGDFTGVFIRAPVVERVGTAVDVLAEYDGAAVFGRAGDFWFSTFHPELSGDLRLHQLFLNEVC